MARASRITCGILAGGEGRRHGGADKAWLPFKDRPLIARLRDQLHPQVDELIVSANRNVERYGTLGLEVVSDTIGQGPIAGVFRLLQAARHPWLLCVPCDTPVLANDIADRFIAESNRHPAVDVVAMHDGSRAHPTFCLIRTELASDIERFIESGQNSLLAWQQTRALVWLYSETPVNLNTPEDLLAAERAH